MSEVTEKNTLPGITPRRVCRGRRVNYSPSRIRRISSSPVLDKVSFFIVCRSRTSPALAALCVAMGT